MSDKLKILGRLAGIIILFIFIAYNLSTNIEAQKKACNEKCHKIIHASTVEAAALSQFPGADNVALAILIGKMVIDLSNVYDIPLNGTAIDIGKSILKQYAIIISTRFASQWLIG